jgi:hypothetical protein
MSSFSFQKLGLGFRRHRVLYGVVLGLLLVWLFGKGCLIFFVSSVAGYSETGHPDVPDDLPSCLAEFSTFANTWPMHYHYGTNLHSNMGYFVCGYSSLETVGASCQKLGWRFQQWHKRTGWYEDFRLDEINGNLHGWIATIPSNERGVFDKGGCTPNDYFFAGRDPTGGYVETGFFRPSDGYFAIWGAKKAQPISEVKGIRTVSIPGIGVLRARGS